SFPSQGLTAFNVTIANDSAADAENVRVVINHPLEAVIQSFEIQVSEPAMAYAIENTERTNQLAVNFPLFARGVDCVCTFLAKGLSANDLSVSIIGKDVVGQKSRSEEPERHLRRVKRLLNVIYIYLILSFLGLTGGTIFSIVIGVTSMNYRQGLDIAELYQSNGRWDKAIATYEEMAQRSWFPSDAQLYYRLAAAYARNSNIQGALLYLQKVARQDPEILDLVTADKSFDALRGNEQLKVLIQQVKR
ncbi:MAG TPA: tetratricopeptide repeat protein, partial [Patescibacteria group bacterium]|nr:tetratricopeptide repeat protein [Patescibacteria group bacterium]